MHALSKLLAMQKIGALIQSLCNWMFTYRKYRFFFKGHEGGKLILMIDVFFWQTILSNYDGYYNRYTPFE